MVTIFETMAELERQERQESPAKYKAAIQNAWDAAAYALKNRMDDEHRKQVQYREHLIASQDSGLTFAEAYRSFVFRSY